MLAHATRGLTNGVDFPSDYDITVTDVSHDHGASDASFPDPTQLRLQLSRIEWWTLSESG
jgi:hypothetical protein